MMKVVLVCLCFGAVLASEPAPYLVEAPPKADGYAPETVDRYVPDTVVTNEVYSKQHYQGMYPGKCGADGFYYMSEYTFMMCSNGNSYEQSCAQGTKNSGHANYATGSDYYIHDFCDVNMVDYGYNVPKEPQYVPNEPHYEPKVPQYKPAQPKKPAGYPVVQKKVVEHKVEYNKPAPAAPVYTDKAAYVGVYSGSCSVDGFYYNNEDSFVMCSNGNAYVQPCAPGSKNSGYNHYQHGSDYSYHDFCDINLVDYGYNAYQGYPGYHAYPAHSAYPGYMPHPKFMYRW